jgi:nucleotide-binding universal stress UspA family protein
MVHRYVVAFDASHPAEAAWAWGIERADADGVECAAVSVVDGTSPASGASGSMVQLVGRVPEALAEFVEDDDVLVIGTGKTGFAHGRVFGFTGVRIVALAPCTVVVVPDIDLRFRSGVVLGVDRAETAASSAAIAAREAARHGEPVHVIRSTARDDDASTTGGRALEIAEHVIRAGWPQLAVRARTTSRPASGALLDAAEAASLLVLGPGVPPDRVPGVPGGVAMEVLVNANAPVLVAGWGGPHPSSLT